MHQLLYVSSAVKHLSQNELDAILKKARHNNRQQDITGMLVYHDGSFVQILEGDKAKIDRLFQTIAQDKRHNHVTLLDETAVSSRSFSNWEMAFRQLTFTEVSQHPTLKAVLDKKSYSSSHSITDIVETFVALTY